MSGKQAERILIVKLGALGDFIQALGPMAAIRKAHPQAHITLLTTKPFEKFAHDCGYVDEIWLDERPGLPDIGGWLRLHKKLNGGGFTRVYDLQNNDRTSLYFRLFTKSRRPEWVGVAKGCSHRNTSPERTAGHAFDGHVQTLALAGITDIKVDRLEWMDGDIGAFPLKSPFVLLVPGCAPERPEKRWSASGYAALAAMLAGEGVQPVIIGTLAEKEAAQEIAQNCPEALDLTDQTSLGQITALARSAAGAVGNDTGPMHLICATGCSGLVLFSGHSDPVRHAPKGEAVQVLRENDLADLAAEAVFEALSL
ncbi:MAG: glycosyltransferase family 9 protein [Alphaproteobacteria bacterium]|nr:glycosyltransferase family 9 protein [Alphaproteobacteria bacterium]